MIKHLVGLVSKYKIAPITLIVCSFSYSIGFAQAPTVNTPTVTAITTTGATLGGTVTGTLTHRGTRWSTTSPVGTSNELEEASTTAGAFTQVRTGLPSAARIFFVAYARNNADVGTTSETVFVTEPLQLTGGQLTASANGSATLNLTFPAANSWAGTGATAGYVIYRNAGSAPSLGALTDGAVPPVDGTGDKIATITDGTATTFNDSGLTAGTNYFYTIIPFAWDGSAATTYNYNLASPQTANDFTFATEPGGHATGVITVTPVSSSQLNLSFNSVTTSSIANAAGYIVLIKSSAIVVGDLATLADGAAPNAFGLFEAIINSTGTGTYSDLSGLSANTTYHYAIIPYNRGSDDQTYNYLTTAGFAVGSGTTPDITAAFTPIAAGTTPVLLSTVLEAGSTSRVVLGFSVTSGGTQVINDLNFSYTGLTSQITNEYIYYGGTTAGTLGSPILTDNSPDGSFSFTSVAPLDKTLDATAKYYYLVLDVSDNVVASTNSISIQLNQGGVVLASGTVSAFSSSRSFTFNTSQLSDIILVPGGTTTPLNYIDYVDPTIDNDQSNSVTLADYQIRDGGAGNDTDNKGMSVTSIEIQVTNAGNLSSIALFNDDTNTEIAGTEQSVSGTGTLNFTFTPTTPISVTDNGSFNLNVRGVFKETVTDNQSIQISIVSVTASSTALSGFSPIGTWASTQTSNAENTINVVATQLEFEQNPPATPVNTDFSATLMAIDASDNIDLNYTGKVDLTIPGGPATLTGGAQSLSPNLIAGQFTWTQLRINQAGTYSLRGRDDAYTGTPLNQPNLGNATASVTISSSASTVTQPSALNLCYGGNFQTLGNIVITETDPSGFSSSGSFSMALPTGFIFDTSVTTAPIISNGTAAPTALTYSGQNIVEFSYNFTSGSANINSITISGLRVRHPHPGGENPPSSSNSITRTGGTAIIAGVISGTPLASVNAALDPLPPGLGFTVEKVNPGDVDVAPGETRFSKSSNPVKLVGSPAGGSGTEFVGQGVSLIAGQYQFNPESLEPGTYPITYRHKTGTGSNCEFQILKNFEVYTTNITNLNPKYCDNEPQTDPMNVDSYIATFYNNAQYSGWVNQKFIYYEPTTGASIDITSPSNDIFDPKLSDYQDVYDKTGEDYSTRGIWIGFVMTGTYDAPPYTTCTTVCIPLGGCFPICTITDPAPESQTRTIWQLIRVEKAPAVSFKISKTSFCDDESAVALIGTPSNSSNEVVDKFEGAPAGTYVLKPSQTISGFWEFDPANVTGVTINNSQQVDITYTYQDQSTFCTATSPPTTLTVHKRPSITLGTDIISVGGSAIELCQEETIPQFDANPTTNIQYNWYLDNVLSGKKTGNSFLPTMSNTVLGKTTFYLTKSNETYPQCESSAAEVSVTIRPLPIINFSWKNPCLETVPFVQFEATELSQPTLTNLVYSWNFSVNNNLTFNPAPASANPLVQYLESGKDEVRLIVSTVFGCTDTLTKPIYILPNFGNPITKDNPYSQDFNLINNWISGGENSSWEWGTLGLKGNENVTTHGKGWDTNLTGTSNKEEQSWVLSECLDLSSIVKPVISLGIFTDTPAGVNGAVLQANVNGNIENDADWITIGKEGGGINWYDTRGISNSPGNQSANDIGWSGNVLSTQGKYNTWVIAINKLDTILNYPRNKVVFRIAFGAGNTQTDGFAFDNVFIGERTRVVLMENFTNNSYTGTTPTITTHNDTYRNLGTAGSEVVKVQYHTPFPGDDPVNALNPQINNARTAFYGITEAPTIRVDGRSRTGGIASWLSTLYDERVLTPSPIEIVPTVTKVDGEVIISTAITNRTGQTLPLQGAHVFITVVQKSVTDAALLQGTSNSEFVFVARQMLPSPTGRIIESNIAAGATYTVPDVIWRFNSGDAIVITVQETGGSKEVYQSHVVLTPPQPDLVTGVEDIAEYITIYPNPANESFEIELPVKADHRMAINLIDPVGRQAQQLYFEKGEQTKTINTQNLAQGIYVVQIGSGKTGVVRKKVLVVH